MTAARWRPVRGLALASVLGIISACGSTGAASPSAAPAVPTDTTSATSGTGAGVTAIGDASAGPSAAGSEAAAAAEKAVKPEVNPPGDIPDNLALINYHSKSGQYTFVHPEGWALVSSGTAVTFKDKLDGFHVEVGTLTTPPTPAAATAQDVPMLASTQPAFKLEKITTFTNKGATGVKILYLRNSEADPVTGKKYRDEVERYELVSGGRELIIELYGPVGSDNVDDYQAMLKSLKFK